jgi:mono/diheme cytochrome c family protein
MLIRVLMPIAIGLLVQACSEPAVPVANKHSVPDTVKTESVIHRVRDVAQIARGGKIFQQNCASCHGEQAQGAPNWHTPGADGKYPAPALNGTAHTWHHPMAALKHTINQGTLAIGGNMPGWKDKLTAGEIDDVLAWIQAKWPDEIWQTWAKNDARSRAGNN